MEATGLSGGLSGGWEQNSLFLPALIAQGVIIVCFAAQWLASARAGRIVLPRAAVYVGVIASVALLGMAVAARDVFVAVAQLMGVLVGIRLIAWMRRITAIVQKPGTRGLPVVAPDSAEWRPPSPVKQHSGTI